MKPKSEWIDKPLLQALEGEGTNAYRLCTRDDGWVERFGRDILISHKTPAARGELIVDLRAWANATGFALNRVFARHLPKKNEERTTPQLVFGDIGENLESIAQEHSLKYKIDFGAGYSVGLFVDQRENRRFIRQAKPKRLLNCFAYTCSFAVAAASGAAQTVNVDLSKKSLARGRENFALNNLPTGDHKFIADDVMSILPRFARKGEKFDTIILDPPTFSRSHRGKVFHVEDDYEDLLRAALEVADRECEILISTNCSTLREKALETMARYCLKLTRRAATFHRQPPPREFPPSAGASTIWMRLR
jgi:23S rRNA (cytosine1962-C5)-methyltransferase